MHTHRYTQPRQYRSQSATGSVCLSQVPEVAQCAGYISRLIHAVECPAHLRTISRICHAALAAQFLRRKLFPSEGELQFSMRTSTTVAPLPVRSIDPYRRAESFPRSRSDSPALEERGQAKVRAPIQRSQPDCWGPLRTPRPDLHRSRPGPLHRCRKNHRDDVASRPIELVEIRAFN